ncbi:acid-sensing ion channel 4-A [Galendromus occidentalis]|uniref:Acid-sensing ion channel 4-A n=1 Tax=Galendromus occidentalis TaxID=34638 RepID=A0AAJ7L553_9ACAR|nr:acid-sensing ion channel 4-A [Galendromus occidentalis]
MIGKLKMSLANWFALRGPKRLFKKKERKKIERVGEDSPLVEPILVESCCSNLRVMMAESQVPGLSSMLRGRSRVRVYTWAFFYIVMTVVALHFLRVLFDDYFSYPISVSIRLEDTAGLLLPAITICNLNPVRRTLICGENTFTLAIPDDIKDYLCNETYRHMISDDGANMVNDFTFWLASSQRLDRDAVKALGHNIRRNVRSCTLQGSKCNLNPGFFTDTFSSTYGNCLTINKQKRESGDFVFYRLGRPEQGLELILNVEINEYLPTTSEAGYIVMIHQHDLEADEATDGIFISPDGTTYIGVNVRKIERLENPYPSHCVFKWPKDSLKPEEDNSYNRANCLKYCLQEAIFTKCGCESVALPTLSNARNICDIIQYNETAMCLENVRASQEQGNIDDLCLCPQACVWVFTTPSIQLATMRGDTSIFNTPAPVRPAPRSAFKETRVKMIVYFQSLIIETIRQVPQYNQAPISQPAGLISNMGGIVGVYLSFGFLVVYEILEILFRASYVAVDFKALSRRIRKKSSEYHNITMQGAREMKRKMGFQNRLRDIEVEPKYFNIERHVSGPPRLRVWDYPSRRQDRAELVPVHRAPEFRVDVRKYIQMKEHMRSLDVSNHTGGDF